MSLLFVFGAPGAGKTYVGRVLQEFFDFHCYEADVDLTTEMIAAIQKKEVFTEQMRYKYFNTVIETTKVLEQGYKKIAVTQALIKEINRQQILQQLPHAQFIYVTANVNTVNQRLLFRDDWVSLEYANKIRAAFEEPQLSHITIDNNLDKQHVINQLTKIL